MKPRHAVFNVVDVMLDEHQSPAAPYESEPIDVGGKIRFTRLPAGMKSGRSSVFIDAQLDDGTRVLFEMSMRSFLTVSAAFTGAEERDGLTP